MVIDFKNETYLDFSQQANRQLIQDALTSLKAKLPIKVPAVIGGERRFGEKTFKSLNPSDPDMVLAEVTASDQAMAEAAIQSAHANFYEWSHTDPKARARILLRAAAIMRRRRAEIDAVEILEAGKPWLEADADVAEAIDFLEFYAREMMRLSNPHELTRIPHEDNELYYMPLGVGISIPPWNFPMAITAGMTTAGLVTGNTMILKPASPTPLTAYLLYEILEEAGLPNGMLQFLPGSGAKIGDYLVQHDLTRFISFTGSKDVGLRINELAAKRTPGQRWLKRVVLEMGGKDTIIVDEGVDLDDAATGVTKAAFGFQGQKCSACSRVIVHESIYDEFLGLLKQKAEQITVGPVEDYNNQMGPVVTAFAKNGIMGYIEIGKKEGRLVLGGKALDRPGYFIEPTIFADVDINARIAQEEIFGPVLAVIKAKNFEEALDMANNSIYGLTGAVYSRNRAHLEKARQDFFVGNLYFNRKCTGALVDVHPFGGFNMSGTDSKAGGRDYLQLFLQAKSVTEYLG